MTLHENKLGRFVVSNELLRRWRDLLPVMGNMVVVEARPRWDIGCVEYLAYSDLFAELPENIAAPHYELTVDEGTIPATIRAFRK